MINLELLDYKKLLNLSDDESTKVQKILQNLGFRWSRIMLIKTSSILINVDKMRMYTDGEMHKYNEITLSEFYRITNQSSDLILKIY